MSESVVYVIPPYILDTCVGLELQRQLYWIDQDLASRNAIVPSASTYFRLPKNLPSKKHAFCDDPAVNEAIKEKLKQKFAVTGILGDSPHQDVLDDYLFELYEIFKSRLRMGGESADNAPRLRLSSRNTTPSSVSTPTDTQKGKRSLFENTKLGEFTFGPKALREAARSGNTASAPFRCMESSLGELMKWARDSNEHKYSFFPYLVVDNTKTFLSPLPMYWTPLSIDKQLEQLEALLGMAVSFENGYSVLEFNLNRLDFLFDDVVRRKRYYNFISNNPVEDRTSVFYYEVLVEQTSTPATNHRPILQANDASLSSGSSLFFSIGYTKRNVRFDKMPTGTGSSMNVQSIDLKEIQSDIAFYNQDAYYKKLDDDTLTFLGAEPGVSFEGSFAVSFNNSCSYASIKSGDNSYRTSSLNMNRRFSQLNRQSASDQETSRLDIEVPFTTHAKLQEKGTKKLLTDTVGCGVNFINKTLFITLNGILVKTVTGDEILSTNRYKDSLFDHGSHLASLFPMIGFQLSEFPKDIGEGELPKSKIMTNFGQRDFMFNINSYVREFKAEQKSELRSTISEELRRLMLLSSMLPSVPRVTAFEKSVRDLKDDPSLLNDFIKGYLIQEGYLETLDSFNTDLVDLVQNTTSESREDIPMHGAQDSKESEYLVEQSDAVKRHKLRNLICNNDFLGSAEFLKSNYPKLELIQRCIFELKVLHYVYLLKQYVQVKFGSTLDFIDGEKSEAVEFFNEAYGYGKHLLESPEVSPSLKIALGELSSVLLVEKKEDIAELPQAKKFMDNLSREVEDLANHVNMAILELRGFEKESKLETMVHSVGRNISALCTENDDPFKMINYEKDFVDV